MSYHTFRLQKFNKVRNLDISHFVFYKRWQRDIFLMGARSLKISKRIAPSYFYFLPSKKCVANNASILKVKVFFVSYFRMNKSTLIMVLLVVVFCSVFVFADPIPLENPKLSGSHLDILCPLQKKSGFPTAQCLAWFKRRLV